MNIIKQLKITQRLDFEWNLQLQEQTYHFRKVKTNLGMMLHFLEGGLHYLKMRGQSWAGRFIPYLSQRYAKAR